MERRQQMSDAIVVSCKHTLGHQASARLVYVTKFGGKPTFLIFTKALGVRDASMYGPGY